MVFCIFPVLYTLLCEPQCSFLEPGHDFVPLKQPPTSVPLSRPSALGPLFRSLAKRAQLFAPAHGR